MINKIRRGSFKGRSTSSSITASQADTIPASSASPTPVLPGTESDAFLTKETQVPAAFPGAAPKDAFVDPTLGGQYKQYADFELPISLVQFFTMFMSDQAKYSLGDFGREGGDIDIVCAPWTAGCALRAKDAFDFEQCEDFSRERTLSMRCPTGGSSYCTVERFQRYYYYPCDGVFLLRSTNYTKGLPLVDTFAGFEKYVVQELDAGKRVRVRYLACVIFHKPPFGFLVTQIKKGCDAACTKSGDKYRDKLTTLVGINASPKIVNQEQESVQVVKPAIINNSQEVVQGNDYKSIGLVALAVVVLLWLVVMLVVQYRIALALEQLARTSFVV